MDQVIDFFKNLFSAQGWPARWVCGHWTPFHGWLYIISSAFIALAYFSIPVTLFYLIRKSKNPLPFQKIFWLFILFILSCGFTHVFDAVMFWYPAYRVSAIVLCITAIVSWMAVFGLFKIIPAALQLKSPEVLENIIAARTQELEESNQRLRQLNEALVLSKTETENLMKHKDEFLGIASHELKTPLTILKAYTEILTENKDLDDKAREHIQSKIAAQINRLGILVYDLLDTTKIKEGSMLYTMEQVNLGQLVKDVTSDMQHTTLSHQISISSVADVTVTCDRERISQVLMNLLSNAIKYSPAKSPVEVSLVQNGATVTCAVKDHGYGIAAEEQQKIFEKFYRAEDATIKTYSGIGLGLYIASNIIAHHKGKIWVESEAGKGAVFYFSLPVQ